MHLSYQWVFLKWLPKSIDCWPRKFFVFTLFRLNGRKNEVQENWLVNQFLISLYLFFFWFLFSLKRYAQRNTLIIWGRPQIFHEVLEALETLSVAWVFMGLLFAVAFAIGICSYMSGGVRRPIRRQIWCPFHCRVRRRVRHCVRYRVRRLHCVCGCFAIAFAIAFAIKPFVAFAFDDAFAVHVLDSMFAAAIFSV